MRHGNFYIKLFLSLFIILAAMQVYFFIDLNFTEERQIHPERNQNRVMKLQVLKALIEENIRRNNGFTQAREDLQEILNRIGKLYNAKIWIQDSKGTPVLESFPPGDRPAKVTTGFDLNARFGDVTISHVFRNGLKFIYTDVPFAGKTGDGLSLHILYEGEMRRYKSQFMIGLAGIILVMVILALSTLQFIRIKVNRFRKSVLRIAGGDLSHRVSVSGRGVVEDLGRAFNGMTDKLEKMITSSKEITANVSHEIRTPLARMRVVEDLLRKKSDRGDFSGYEKHLDYIKEDIQILDDLTGRLLEFVKLDNHESTPKHEHFNPSELINDLLIRFAPIIESKALNIKKDISFYSAFKGDRKALTSAFLNILDNAFKFIPEHGDITIKIHPEGNFFETNIINTFERLDQKDLDNIFKPFERSRQSNPAGSGLGLAITRKIIENHGGNIAALNSPDGFEIRIRIPLTTA